MEPFEHHIHHLRRRVRVRTVFQAMFWLLFVFLGLFALARLVERIEGFSFQAQRPTMWYGGLLVAAVAGSAIITITTRKRFHALLIEIDSRLKLQDVLSTAYEYQSTGKFSAFQEALFEDAARHLNRLSRKELLPFTFSRPHLFLILLLFFHLGWFALDRVVPVSGQRVPDNRKLTERPVVQPETRPQPVRERDQFEPEEQQKLAGRLRDLSKQLQEHTLAPEEFSTALNELLQEVQSTQDRLARGAAAQDESINLRDMPIRQMPLISQSQPMLPKNLKELEQLLKDLLSNQSAPAQSGVQAQLSDEERQQLSDVLSKIAKDIEVEKNSQPESPSTPDSANVQTKSDSDQPSDESGGQAEKHGIAESQQNGQEDMLQDDVGQGVWGAYGRGRDNKDNGEDQGNASSAGRGAGNAEEYATSFPGTSRNPVVQDKILSTPKEEYNVHIRSVTSIGKAEAPEETVVRPYRQEVESILHREDIPVNYQEFIKNYFLSIGLTRE